GPAMSRYYEDSAQLNVRAALEAGQKNPAQNLTPISPQAGERACTDQRPELESGGPNGELPMSPGQGQVGRVPERPCGPRSEVQILSPAAEGRTGTLPPPENNQAST